MSEQEEQREAERYQEWRAERDANEEQQYHIYLEQRIKELDEALTFAHAKVVIRDKRIEELKADIVKIEANADYHADTSDEFMGRIVALQQRLEAVEGFCEMWTSRNRVFDHEWRKLKATLEKGDENIR